MRVFQRRRFGARDRIQAVILAYETGAVHEAPAIHAGPPRAAKSQ
jgi:hypothetical protein